SSGKAHHIPDMTSTQQAPHANGRPQQFVRGPDAQAATRPRRDSSTHPSMIISHQPYEVPQNYHPSPPLPYHPQQMQKLHQQQQHQQQQQQQKQQHQHQQQQSTQRGHIADHSKGTASPQHYYGTPLSMKQEEAARGTPGSSADDMLDVAPDVRSYLNMEYEMAGAGDPQSVPGASGLAVVVDPHALLSPPMSDSPLDNPDFASRAAASVAYQAHAAVLPHAAIAGSMGTVVHGTPFGNAPVGPSSSVAKGLVLNSDRSTGTPGIAAYYSASMPILGMSAYGLMDQNGAIAGQPSSYSAYGPDGDDASFNGPHKPMDVITEKRRRRRESHNLVERRRRDNINEKIQELASLLPDFPADVQNRPNKGTILCRSVDYIRQMQTFAMLQVDRALELEQALAHVLDRTGLQEADLGLSMPLGSQIQMPQKEPSVGDGGINGGGNPADDYGDGDL
ncbi:hypothetical protein HKX48_007152, partial [Thoreauomyces humboldtii]